MSAEALALSFEVDTAELFGGDRMERLLGRLKAEPALADAFFEIGPLYDLEDSVVEGWRVIVAIRPSAALLAFLGWCGV